jgi:hypothetical protein
MTELTPILNSVHTPNDRFQKRIVLLSVVTIIESDCSEQSDMTEMTTILNSVHSFNDSLQKTKRSTQRGHQHRMRL